MGKNNYLKIFTLLAFIAFGLVSCWATAESLHLLLPSWPLAFCWIVTIGFFFIASYGTKMIVDSFNQNIYIEKRGLRLIGGIVITICFWLICIMPTNTHTFFFRNVINDKVNSDITTTLNYLSEISSDKVPKTKIKQQQNNLQNLVNSKLTELDLEIQNEANPGYGPKAKNIFNDFAKLFNIANIQPLTFKGVYPSKQEREILSKLYRNKIYALMQNRFIEIKNLLEPTNSNHKKLANTASANINLVKKYINNGQINLNDAKDIQTVCNQLNNGYSVIKAYPQFVNFISIEDKVLYTSNNPVSKVKRLTSVFDVWEDFLGGFYAGHGFTFWVIISILVDIAAFIFFDITFKNEN